MRRLLLTFVCFQLFSMFLVAGDREIHVTVRNPLNQARAGETISLSWVSIRKYDADLSPSNITVIDQKGGADVLSQTIGDEFLFQADFNPNETRLFVLKVGSTPRTERQNMVDGRFMKPREDYAWENDRIAFRMYGPALATEVSNGIDVWVKRIRSLVVQKWYKGDEDTGSARVSYHIDHGEGADFFNVGRTLGAGGCAIWKNRKVHQPGVFSSFKTLANGPLRTVFELYYDSLNVDGEIYKERCRISLDAGQNLNRIQVTYDGSGSGQTIEIAAGLVKRANTVEFKDKNHSWVSLWGLTNEDSTNGFLGTGVLLPNSAFKGFAEDKDQYLIVADAKTGHLLTYYAGAGWTRSGDFTSANDWNEYLSAFSTRLRNPLKITITEERK